MQGEAVKEGVKGGLWFRLLASMPARVPHITADSQFTRDNSLLHKRDQ